MGADEYEGAATDAVAVTVDGGNDHDQTAELAKRRGGDPHSVDCQISEKSKFTLLQAIGFNTMNMFGSGPLITIPYCLASVSPQGPHAMLGYGIACVACICDSLIWAEIGSMWPISGGPFIYLRELYGRETFGRLVSFMYVWQFFVSCPCEVAAGFIAVAEYLVYFDPAVVTYGPRIGISLTCLTFCGALLFRGIGSVGKVTTVLWIITLCAIVFTLVAGFSDFHPEYLRSPPDAFTGDWRKTVGTIAAATSFGVYDMAGYYDVCYMGGAIRNARKNIPRSCITTCCCVAVIFILVYLAVLGHLDWREFIEDYNDPSANPPGIMSRFTESRFGPEVAMVLTVVVAITIFGSTFSILCGQTYVPYAAAKEKIFFQVFCRESSGVPDISLLTIIVLSAVWCFFSLDLVIKGLVTIIVFIQFMGQSVGLMYYRWRTPVEEQPPGFRMPLFPLPCLIQFCIFFFIWITTDSVLLWGSKEPVLEIAVMYLLTGTIIFLVHARLNRSWPFKPTKGADPSQQSSANELEESSQGSSGSVSADCTEEHTGKVVDMDYAPNNVVFAATDTEGDSAQDTDMPVDYMKFRLGEQVEVSEPVLHL